MATFPFRNLGLKLVSICIAGLLWLVVSGERVVERILHAPVEFQNLPDGLEMIGTPPETIDVRVRGPSGALSRMEPGDLATVLDLRTSRAGRRLFQLTPSHVRAPYGVEVIQVAPSTLVVEFEPMVSRIIPVEPAVEGQPAAGFEVTGVTVEPSTVEVEGPQTVLRRLTGAITEPISIANQSRSVREVVTIGVGDANARLKQPVPATITVTIEAVKRR